MAISVGDPKKSLQTIENANRLKEIINRNTDPLQKDKLEFSQFIV